MFGGKPKTILEMAIERDIQVAVSDLIIQEVRRHLLGKFGWSGARAADALESISEYTKHVTPTEIIDAIPSDPDDNRVLECRLRLRRRRRDSRPALRPVPALDSIAWTECMWRALAAPLRNVPRRQPDRAGHFRLTCVGAHEDQISNRQAGSKQVC